MFFNSIVVYQAGYAVPSALSPYLSILKRKDTRVRNEFKHNIHLIYFLFCKKIDLIILLAMLPCWIDFI